MDIPMGFQPANLQLPCPTGFRSLNSIKEGDFLFDANGHPTKVTKVSNFTIRDIYRIGFNDGRAAYCNEEHAWMLIRRGRGKDIRFLSTLKEFKEDFKYFSEARFRNHSHVDPNRYRYRIPTVGCSVNYKKSPVPIDPYVLGAFIASRMILRNSLTIKSQDDYVPSAISARCNFSYRKMDDKDTYKFYKNDEPVSSVEFFEEFPQIIKSDVKYREIPSQYLFNDASIRMDLLRGIMDNAGHIHLHDRKYAVSLNFSAEKFLQRMKDLIMGLGYQGYYISKLVDRDGWETHNVGLTFSIPNKFKAEIYTHPEKRRKALAARSLNERKSYNCVTIKDIELIGKKKSRGILVDSADGLYLTQDFIVTHC